MNSSRPHEAGRNGSQPEGTEPEERKVLVLTGATGRFGTAFCRAHAADYDIVAVSRGRRPAVASDRQSFVDPLRPGRALEANAHPVFELGADISRPEDIDRIVEITMARYGRIDVLVNAAGVPGQGWLLAGGLANAARVMRINALAPIELATRFGDAFWRHRHADNAAANRCIVNLSAAAAVDASGGAVASFAASKAALNILTAHLAEELRPFRVRANAVAPVAFPAQTGVDRVVAAVHGLVEGDETGRVLLLWDQAEELV